GFGGKKNQENELKKVKSGPRYLAWSTRCYPQKRKNFHVGAMGGMRARPSARRKNFLSVMASKADKGKQIEVANEGLKRLRKETKG
ncbi:hypothetical protein HAX54_039632, partial [Datura stramonium]|nr:hypothetical protein [Datura stramonium]